MCAAHTGTWDAGAADPLSVQHGSNPVGPLHADFKHPQPRFSQCDPPSLAYIKIYSYIYYYLLRFHLLVLASVLSQRLAMLGSVFKNALGFQRVFC